MGGVPSFPRLLSLPLDPCAPSSPLAALPGLETAGEDLPEIGVLLPEALVPSRSVERDKVKPELVVEAALLGASVFTLARPSSTFLAREAKSREHFVSGTLSTAGETLTTMTHFALEPSESSRSLVSLLLR